MSLRVGRSVSERLGVLPLAVAALATALFVYTGLSRQDAFLNEGWWYQLGTMHYRLAEFFSLPQWYVIHAWPRGPRNVVSAICSGIFWPLEVWLTALAVHWILKRLGKPQVAGEPKSAAEESSAPAGEAFSRRSFLRAGAYAVPTAFVLLGGYSSGFAPERIVVRRLRFPVKGLPAGLHGLCIAHLSDFHISEFIGPAYIRRVLQVAEAEKADIALLTGDYVTDGRGFPMIADLIADYLRPQLGIWCTLGNHDHWQNADKCRAEFKRVGLPLIDNDRRFLTRDGMTTEPQPDSICIAGLGDYWEDKMDFAAALGGVPGETPRIILSHNPDSAEVFRIDGTTPPRIDLMLSGHTHGGQVSLPGVGALIVPSRYGQKYAGGLVQGPHWPVHISRGIGMAVLPVRFRVPPEFSIITLTTA